ncbi:MAG: hypothetical protein ACHQ49_08810 [Elusimicrobiota bacterium]
MIAAFTALVIAASAHAAPAAMSFEQSLMQLHSDVLAASALLNTQEQLKKADKNVQLTANQAWQGKSNLSNLTAQARVHGNDPTLGSQLYQLQQDLDVYAQNCEVVRKQVLALEQTSVKDPALVALAKKLYQDARVLDSNAGYLAIEAQNDNSTLGVAGFGGQAYQIQRLAESGASFTPDTRVAAKSILAKVQ